MEDGSRAPVGRREGERGGFDGIQPFIEHSLGELSLPS